MGGLVPKQWFLQLNGQSRGPIPAWQISRYLLLQRLNRNSLVSRDGAQWQPLGELPELDPHRRLAIADLPVEERSRLEATLQWVMDHPRLFEGVEEGSREGERRYHEGKEGKRKRAFYAVATVAMVILLIAAIPILLPSPPEVAAPQCSAAAAPAVNWSNCMLAGSQLAGSDLSGAMLRNVNLSASKLRGASFIGADLNYANLSLVDLEGGALQNAQLKGARLRNANLNRANLQGADLSYADLSGASMVGADFTAARLGNVVWEEGIYCMPESVGRCIQARSVR